MQQELFSVTGHVIGMNYDTTQQMTGVIVMQASGIPAMMEVYDKQLEELIHGMEDGEQATFLFDRFCMLESIQRPTDRKEPKE